MFLAIFFFLFSLNYKCWNSVEKGSFDLHFVVSVSIYKLFRSLLYQGVRFCVRVISFQVPPGVQQ